MGYFIVHVYQRKCYVSILYHAIGNTVANTIHSPHNCWIAGCNTVENATAFLYSDLLSVFCMAWYKIVYLHVAVIPLAMYKITFKLKET